MIDEADFTAEAAPYKGKFLGKARGIGFLVEPEAEDLDFGAARSYTM